MPAIIKCARVLAAGGPEQVAMGDYALSDVKLEANQVLLRNAFAGVNFIDTYYRTGLYSKPGTTFPYIPGDEGSGSVLQCGPGVDNDAWLGKRVAFFRSVGGAYASFSIACVDDLFPVADGVSDEVAAAAMLQGCTAHYLTHDCFKCAPGTTVLVHAAAGGTGLLISQFAKKLGATVIGVCGSKEKAALASTQGRCDFVIDYSVSPDWPAAVRALAPDGVHAVYDGVGRATFDGSMSCLAKRGAMVSFGNASGAVPAVTPLTLTKHGSVSLQRPSLKDFCSRAGGEIDMRVKDVFDSITDGSLQVHVGAVLPLAQARESHEMLESKASVGKILLNCLE